MGIVVLVPALKTTRCEASNNELHWGAQGKCWSQHAKGSPTLGPCNPSSLISCWFFWKYAHSLGASIHQTKIWIWVLCTSDFYSHPHFTSFLLWSSLYRHRLHSLYPHYHCWPKPVLLTDDPIQCQPMLLGCFFQKPCCKCRLVYNGCHCSLHL